MGIDLFQGRHRRDLSINPAATNPFAEDFLNPYYYLELMPKIDTVALVRLGKFLFFDPVISHSEQMACASCHDPKRAFADGKPKSLDNRGHEVLRNSPGLINAVYADRYFYDLRADGLNTQIEDVIHNQKEFQTSSWTIANKLNRSAEYQELFQEAFPLQSGSQLINKYAVSAALGAYVQSLQAYNSPFDQYIRGETEAIAPEVVEGFNLFMGKANCGTCHFPPTFSGLVPPDFHENETEVLGVPTDRAGTQLDGDIGRRGNGWFTEKADHYRFSFKTVGLRNVALTAPYMHNGVFETLEEVLDFYNRGGGEGMDLAVPHQTLAPDSLGLSEQEQQAIIRFLEALTDTVGTSSYPRKLPVFDDGSQWSRLDRKLDN
jgi:cytochrome c peroxidase